MHEEVSAEFTAAIIESNFLVDALDQLHVCRS